MKPLPLMLHRWRLACDPSTNLIQLVSSAWTIGTATSVLLAGWQCLLSLFNGGGVNIGLSSSPFFPEDTIPFCRDERLMREAGLCCIRSWLRTCLVNMKTEVENCGQGKGKIQTFVVGSLVILVLEKARASFSNTLQWKSSEQRRAHPTSSHAPVLSRNLAEASDWIQFSSIHLLQVFVFLKKNKNTGKHELDETHAEHDFCLTTITDYVLPEANICSHK